jgi:hypothetical protein
LQGIKENEHIRGLVLDSIELGKATSVILIDLITKYQSLEENKKKQNLQVLNLKNCKIRDKVTEKLLSSLVKLRTLE